MRSRVLILTPWVPYPVTGACQQDRFFGMRQLKSLGYDLKVIAKIHDFQDAAKATEAFAKEGVPLTTIPYMKHRAGFFLKKIPAILKNPGLLDGAAIEYLDPDYLRVLHAAMKEYKPDVLWIEYCVHWPLLRILKSYGVPVIVKSSLNEPKNCVDEHGGSLIARLKALPKYVGERTVAREADKVLAITPDEERWYRSLGAKNAGTLPLRGLSQCFAKKTHTEKQKLDVVFLSSNYNMGHNRDALLFLLQKIVPAVRAAMPGVFTFHLTGSKFPEHYKKFLADDIRYVGFVSDLGNFLATMDIALCPWRSGHGMQQKVFEPLCRSLPLLTTKTAGYPIENGKEVLLCRTPEDYVEGLRRLRDAGERNSVAEAAYIRAQSLFSESVVKSIADAAIREVLKQ